jgi:hypothetical protein
MVVDFDSGRHEELSEWENQVVGRAYEVVSGDHSGRVFVVRDANEHTEKLEGQLVKKRLFSYEWLDTEPEEVSLDKGIAAITICRDSDDNTTPGTESIQNHKKKTECGIYRELNYERE